MRILKTRRQKVDHVEFNSTGALLAHGYDEVACWLNPVGVEKPFSFSTRYTWGAAFTGLGNQLAVSNSSGLLLVYPEDDRRSQVLGEEERGYTITPGGRGRLLLHTNLYPEVWSTRNESRG